VTQHSSSRTHTRQRRLREVISFILSYILTFGFTGMILVVLVGATVCSQGYLVEKMEQSSYIAITQAEVIEVLESYGTTSGVESGFFESSMANDTFADYVKSETAKIFGPSPQGFDRDEYRGQLYDQLVAYAEVKDIELSDDVQEALGYLADLCADEYKSAVSLPMIGALNSAMSSLQRMLLPLFLFFLVLIALDVAFILKIRPRGRKFKAFRYICSALIATGAIFLLAGIVAKTSGVIETVAITSESLYKLVVAYCQGIFDTMIITGIVVVIVGALAALAFYLIRKHNRQKRLYLEQ
jgi:preprotein translocase subunit YajC